MCLIKYVENELLYSTVPLPKIKNKKKKGKERQRGGKNTVQLQKPF